MTAGDALKKPATLLDDPDKFFAGNLFHYKVWEVNFSRIRADKSLTKIQFKRSVPTLYHWRSIP